MRRAVLLLAVVLSGFGALRNSAAAPAELNVFIWSEYLDPAVVADFERTFECKVTIDLYEDDAAMMAKLQAGGAKLYDVVVPPDHRVTALVKLGLLAPLRPENVPNLKHLDPKFARPPFDPENKFTVAYQWGTVGLLVRKGADGSIPTATWGLVFDEKQSAGPFVLLDNARDVLGAALKFCGRSLNSTEAADLRAARETLLQAKPRAVALEGSVGARNRVVGKSARVAMVYSGEAARAITEDASLVYLIPQEGSQIWLDSLAIPSGAPHRDLAEKFINFLLDPAQGARISNFTQFATPNAAARLLLDPGVRANPAIYPSEDVVARLEFLRDLGAKSRLYDEVWTQVKAR